MLLCCQMTIGTPNLPMSTKYRYAARKQRGYFRLPNADAVRQYVVGEPSSNVV